VVDALKIISGSASDNLTAKVARGPGAKSVKLEIKKFPDGEKYVIDPRTDQEGGV
jgi:phosphoribosylpyrophosphate synthetase